MAEPTSESKPDQIAQNSPETLAELPPIAAGSSPKLSVSAPKKRDYTTVPFWLGLALSVAWIVIVTTAIVTTGSDQRLGGILLTHWAIGLSAIASPVALIWMVTAYLQRAADIQVMTDPLRRQLNIIIGENSVAENRVKRFNAAIREQIELLRQGSTIGEEEIVKLLRQLSWEREEVKKIAMHRMAQLHEAGKITHAAEMFDGMLANKLKQIGEIEERLRTGNSMLSKNADQLRLVLGDVLSEIKDGHQSLVQSLSLVKSESQELRGHLRDQESDIIAAQNNLKKLLEKSEQEFDVILGRFYDRSKDAESAMDGATTALEGRIALLEKASNGLPEKITAATEQLNAAIANYATVEQTAHRMAVATGNAMEQHTALLAEKIDGFDKKIQNTGKDLADQRQALAAMLDRIAAATGDVYANLKSGAESLNNTANGSLAQFKQITAQVKSEAEALTAELRAMTEAYSASAQDASGATELHQLRMAALQEQMSENINLLQDYESKSRGSSEGFQQRAGTTLQLLQQMESRLHSLNSAVAEAGDHAQHKLQSETESYRSLIAQLATAAEESAHTVQRATDKLGTQHDGLIDRATRSEAQLQKLILELSHLHESSNTRYEHQLKAMHGALRETSDLLRTAELQLQDFSQRSLDPMTVAARKVTEAAAESSASMEAFAARLEDQASHIAAFEEKVSAANSTLEASATKSSSVIGTLLTSLFNLGRQQDDVTQKVAQNFSRSTEQLQHGLSSLDQQTKQVVTTLTQSATQVVEQTTAIAQAAAQAGETLQNRLQAVHEAEAAQTKHYTHHLALVNDGLQDTKKLLESTEDKLLSFSIDTLEPLAEGTRKIKDAAAQGEASLVAFSHKLQEQAEHIAGFETRLHTAQEHVETATAKSGRSIGAFISDLLTIGQKQEETEAKLLNSAAKTQAALTDTMTALQMQTESGLARLVTAQQTLNAVSGAFVAETAEADLQLQERVKQITLLHSEQNLRYAQHQAALRQGLLDTSALLDVTEQRLHSFGSTALGPINRAMTGITEAAAGGNNIIRAFSEQLSAQTQLVSRYHDTIATAHNTLESSAAKSSSLWESLSAKIKELGLSHETLTQKVDKGLTEAADKLGKNLVQLSEQVATAESNLTSTHDKLAQQSTTLVAQVGDAETAMRSKLSALQTALGEVVQKIDATDLRLQRFGTDALPPLLTATQQLDSAAKVGETSIGSFAAVLVSQLDSISSIEQRLDRSQKTLAATTQQSESEIGNIIEKLSSIGEKQNQVLATVEQRLDAGNAKLQASLETINQQADDAAGRLDTVSDIAISRSKQLAAAAEQAEQGLSQQAGALEQLHSEHKQLFGEHMAQISLGLRETNDTLAQVRLHMDGFETGPLARVQHATQRIAEATEQGSTSIDAFANRLDERANHITALHDKLQATNAAMDSTTTRNNATIDAMLANLQELNRQQELLAQRVESSFTGAAGKLGQEITKLGTAATETSSALEAAESRLAQRHESMQQQAASTVTTLDGISASLQNRSVLLHDTMQTQLESIVHELAALEGRFGQTGNALREQADTAHSVMDKASARFTQLTAELSHGIEGKTEFLQNAVAQSVLQISTIGNALQEKLQLISGGNEGLQQVAEQLASANESIIAQLTRLQEESKQASRVMQDNAAISLNELAVANSAIEQQQRTLRQTAEQVATDLARAGETIESHAGRLQQVGQTHEAQIKLLHSNLEELDQKSTSLRAAMSQHAGSLVSELQAGVGQLQVMSDQLQNNVMTAVQSADTAQARFGALSRDSGEELQARMAQMQALADQVSLALTAMRGGVSEQLHTLHEAVEKITAEQTTLQGATTAQREELLSMFDKLAQAHQMSAASAEQSIARFASVTAEAGQALAGFSTEAQRSLQAVAQASGGFAHEAQNITVQSQQAAQQVRDIMSVTEALADHARSIAAQTSNEASRISATLANVIGQMDGQSVQLQDRTTSLLRDISASNANVTVQIADALTNLQQAGSQVREQISAQALGLREQTNREAEHLLAGAQQLADTLSAGERLIQNRAQDVRANLSEAGNAIAANFTSLLDALATNNDKIRQQLVEQSDKIRAQALQEAEAMGQAFGHMLHDIERSGQQLSTQADAVLMRIGASHSDIKGALGQSLADIGQTHDLVAAQMQDSLQAVTQGTTAMRAEMTAHIAAQRDSALAEASLYGDKLTELLGSIGQGSTALRDQSGVIAQTLAANRGEIQDQFTQLLENIEQRHTTVQQRIAQHVAQLRATADSEAERFSGSLTHLLGQIDGSIGHLRFQSEDVLARIMQGGAQAKREFTNILTHIAESQVKIKAELSDFAAGLRQQSRLDMEQIAGDLNDMLTRIDGSGELLREQVRDAVGTLDLGGGALAQQVTLLLEQINANHAAIRGRMMEQAAQMRDEFGGEVARMADGLRAVMSQLQEAGLTLKDQNNLALNHLDQSALRFSQTTKQAAQSLFDQIAQLDSTTAIVADHLQSLGNNLQQEQVALAQASNNINSHTVQMAAQTAAAAEQLRHLLSAIAESNTQTQGLSSHVAGQLQGMIIHLREEMQRLSEHSAMTAQAAGQVAQQVAASTEGLMQASAQIRHEGTSLPQVIDIAEERLQRAGEQLRAQAAAANQLLESQAGSFVQIFTGEQQAIVMQTEQLQQVAAQAGKTLQQFGQQLAAQLGTLQSSGTGVELLQQKLVDQTAAAIAHMGVACDRLNNLRQGAETAHDQLLGKIQYMDGQAQATTKVMTVGSQMLTSSIHQLSEVSQKTQQEMMGVGAQYRGQLEELRRGLQQELQGLHENIGSAAQLLEQKSETLRHATAAAGHDIEQLLARFDIIANSSTSLVADKTAALHKLADDAAQLLLGFGKTVDAQLEHLASASENIGTTQKYLSSTLDASIQQVDVLQDKLESSRTMAQSSTEQVSAQLQKLSQTLQQHIDHLGQNTKQAVGLVDAAGHSWQDQAQNLARIAQQARSELAAISYAIDALQQKGSNMRDNFRGQGQDLMNSLNQVIDNMEATASAIEIADDPLVNRMERGLQKIS